MRERPEASGSERATTYADEEEQGRTRSEGARDSMEDALQRLEGIVRGGRSAERQTPASRPSPTSGLQLEEFIEAASSAVLRAIDARNARADDERGLKILDQTITVGIVFLPRGSAAELIGSRFGGSGSRDTAQG